MRVGETGRVSRSVVLPSGVAVTGRRITDIPEVPADFLLALADGPLPPWPCRRINWPDFWIPTDRSDALDFDTHALAGPQHAAAEQPHTARGSGGHEVAGFQRAHLRQR